jgi:hypothetical protein
MKVEHKGHTTIIRNTQGSTADFLQKLLHEYNSYKNQNLILDLSHDKDLTMDVVKTFAGITKSHKKEKKSVIVVANNLNCNEAPKTITLVPTILEAHDIIELEETERDLGF